MDIEDTVREKLINFSLPKEKTVVKYFLLPSPHHWLEPGGTWELERQIGIQYNVVKTVVTVKTETPFCLRHFPIHFKRSLPKILKERTTPTQDSKKESEVTTIKELLRKQPRKSPCGGWNLLRPKTCLRPQDTKSTRESN